MTSNLTEQGHHSTPAKLQPLTLAGYQRPDKSDGTAISTVTVKSFHPSIISTDEDLLLVIEEASRLRKLQHV